MSQVYADVAKKMHEGTTHGVEVMQVTAETIRKRANVLPEYVRCNDRIGHIVRIVLAPIRDIKYRDDDKSLRGESTLYAERENKPQRSNMQVLQSSSPQSPEYSNN